LYKFCGVLENLCSIWSGSGSEAGTGNFLSWNRNKSKRFHNTVLICEMLESVNGNRCIIFFIISENYTLLRQCPRNGTYRMDSSAWVTRLWPFPWHSSRRTGGGHNGFTFCGLAAPSFFLRWAQLG
jgi:hypothetical protein